MLQVTIPEREWFDSEKQKFINIKPYTLKLEHSLKALSKWEEKHCKPFLGKDEKTPEEALDYIKCMVVNEDQVPVEVYRNLSDTEITLITNYINAPMTATWFNNSSSVKKRNKEIITAEIIYYLMIMHGIPVDFENWHIAKLITLIRVCDVKNSPAQKVNREEMLAERRALNLARRKQLGSKG